MRYYGPAFLALLLLTGNAAGEPASDESLIRQVLGDYVSGWREGDVEKLASVFAADGSVMWVSDNSGSERLGTMTFSDVLKRRKSQPQYGLDWRVLSLDVVDSSVAVSKLQISRKGGSYVDFLVLYKIAERWRIVNKTFSVRSD